MKKNCLLLLPRPVFPLVCGYALKNYNLIQILADNYYLKVFIIAEKDILEEEKEYYHKLGVEYHVHSIKKVKSYWNTLRGLFSTIPLQVCYYFDKDLQRKLVPYITEADVLISALVRTRIYLNIAEKMPEKKIVFDMVDSIALNYKRSKNNTKSLFWKLIYKIESNRLLKFEERCVKNSAVTYLFNPQEQKYWSNYGNVRWLPHGVNRQLFSYEKKNPELNQSVVFIGKMDYQPNVDAVLWYLENVQAKIGKNVPFVVVGAYPTEQLIETAKKYENVTFTGFVDDPYIYVASAMAVVAPMQTGGGIQNKVLEGMALGKVNIISSLAAAPIVGAEAGKHFLVADSGTEYESYILDLKNNMSKYHQIGEEARKLIQATYSWDAYGEMYLEGIKD